MTNRWVDCESEYLIVWENVQSWQSWQSRQLARAERQRYPLREQTAGQTSSPAREGSPWCDPVQETGVGGGQTEEQRVLVGAAGLMHCSRMLCPVI